MKLNGKPQDRQKYNLKSQNNMDKELKSAIIKMIAIVVIFILAHIFENL